MYREEGAFQTHPPTTFRFLSLTRELRDKIYALSLVSSSPVIIWWGEIHQIARDSYADDISRLPSGPYCVEGPESRPGPLRLSRVIDDRAAATSIQNLALGLL
jgi:hypothetical protein